MGKYTKRGLRAGKLSEIGAEAKARAVIDALVEAIGVGIDRMRDNYIRGLEIADTELMSLKLAAWYKHLPAIARGFARAMREAKSRVYRAPR